ncbi:hypothetical protein H4219_006444 [Mycoemilia scoparia]|uniref:Uncharacterized protein n=1 Tax=Mycoemilia scoparia TaxID=417184 RepID=A0A9W7ZN50_9FUNG|nr:hypothetical protein H4219_006444 [Mycoemilia scoparia]
MNTSGTSDISLESSSTLRPLKDYTVSIFWPSGKDPNSPFVKSSYIIRPLLTALLLGVVKAMYIGVKGNDALDLSDNKPQSFSALIEEMSKPPTDPCISKAIFLPVLECQKNSGETPNPPVMSLKERLGSLLNILRGFMGMTSRLLKPSTTEDEKLYEYHLINNSIVKVSRFIVNSHSTGKAETKSDNELSPQLDDNELFPQLDDIANKFGVVVDAFLITDTGNSTSTEDVSDEATANSAGSDDEMFDETFYLRTQRLYLNNDGIPIIKNTTFKIVIHIPDSATCIKVVDDIFDKMYLENSDTMNASAVL